MDSYVKVSNPYEPWRGRTIHKSLKWIIAVIGFINKWFLQLFFIRLAFILNVNGNDQFELNAICLLYGVVPFTGWSSPYKYLPKHGTLGA